MYKQISIWSCEISLTRLFLQLRGTWRLNHGKKWSVWAPGTAALTESRWNGRICVKLELIKPSGVLSLVRDTVWCFPAFFSSQQFVESYQCIKISRDYRAGERLNQWVGWEDGRGGRNASQAPCDGFSVFSRDQVIHYYLVNIGPRLTLIAFVLCYLAHRLQGVQHKENIASSEATLDLVEFISSSFML